MFILKSSRTAGIYSDEGPDILGGTLNVITNYKKNLFNQENTSAIWYSNSFHVYTTFRREIA